MIKLHIEELLVKPVNKEVLKEAANKLMFDMSDKEYETLIEEFEIITKQMELIGEIPGVDDVEPMTFPFEVTNDYLRDDVIEETITKEDALKNSKRKKGDYIVLPRVVK